MLKPKLHTNELAYLPKIRQDYSDFIQLGTTAYQHNTIQSHLEFLIRPLGEGQGLTVTNLNRRRHKQLSPTPPLRSQTNISLNQSVHKVLRSQSFFLPLKPLHNPLKHMKPLKENKPLKPSKQKKIVDLQPSRPASVLTEFKGHYGVEKKYVGRIRSHLKNRSLMVKKLLTAKDF